VTQNCKPSALLPFDQSADHSSLPAKFRTPCRRLLAGGERQCFALDGRGGNYGSLAIPQVDARPIALIPQSSNLFVGLARGIRSQ
jgi:hypothetical protein